MGEALREVRVLFVIPSIPLGGMERANIRIASILASQGGDVLAVTESNFGQRVEQELVAAGIRCAPISVIESEKERPRFPRGIGDLVSLVLAWIRVSWQLMKLYRRHRATHLYLTNAAYVVYALPILLFGKARSIFRTPEAPAIALGGIRGKIHDWFWRVVIGRGVDVIVCNSDFTRRRLELHGIKARLIRNCVPRRAATLSREPREMNVVYVGAVYPVKGVHVFVEAAISLAARFPSARFQIIGPPEWQTDYAERLRQRVRESGLEDRILFLGEREDVQALLGRAAIHVSPSIQDDSFPNVVLEAKEAGLPSVVFPTGGLPEAVRDRVDGFVCKSADAESLIEGIEYFLSDRDRLMRASVAARESLQQFSVEKATREWKALFAGDRAASICLVTTSHLAANPRLLKEAGALAGAGYDVRVVSCEWDDQWRALDESAAANRRWRWDRVNWSRRDRPFLFWRSRFRHQIALRAVFFPRLWSAGRIVPELRDRVASERSDLLIAHNAGGLAAAFAAQAGDAKLGYDAEDFVPGMSEPVATRIEKALMPACDYVTVSSPLIGKEYEETLGVKSSAVILNTFPLSWRPDTFVADDHPALKLYWFSQTIGAGRGLEDVIRAMAKASPRPIEFHVQGRWQTGYQERLIRLADEAGVSALHIHDAVPPSDLVRMAASCHIGLGLEPGNSRNNSIALSNKLFTYLLAGAAVILTATDSQRLIAAELADAASTYHPGDSEALATHLIRLHDDRGLLAKARQISRELGATRFNWDVEQERFLSVVRETLSS